MRHNRKIVYLAGFLFSLPVALAAYVNSSFISNFVGEKFSGMVFVLGSALSIIALILAPKIFQRIGVLKFLIAVLVLDTITFGLLSFLDIKWLVIGIFVLGLCLNTLVIFSLDELLKIFSKEKATGGIRGAYIAICNIAWILSQLVSGFIIGGDLHFKEIYLVDFFIMIALVIISLINFKKIPEPNYNKVENLSYIKEFFSNKNLAHSYTINTLLHFFFGWMIIYTPIYLSVHLHFTWMEISKMFAIMLIPFLILPYPLGKYSDKIGERKMLMVGFTIMALSSILAFFITRHEVLIWALVLFMTRIGAATVEAMSDSYFFKHVTSEQEQFVGVYRSSPSVAYIIAPIVAFIVFSVTPTFKFIYLILGVVMLYGTYLSSTINRKDI